MTKVGMHNLHIKTPLLESRRLREQSPIWLKLENTQPSGSFKTRGIGYACQQYSMGGARGFISSSGGNAGLAVAYAGRMLGIPVKVIVPETTTVKAKDLIRCEGAQVVVHGASWTEAHDQALILSNAEWVYIHPFDDPLIWKGHASLVEELAEQRGKPEAIVVSVGGGGFFCGIVEGLKNVGWSDVTVVAVETSGADSLNQSIKAGELVELEEITSIATSLGAKKVAEHAFELAGNHPTTSLVVSDQEAVQGCRALLDSHHILVEPACGAAVSAALKSEFSDLVAVVCGGVGVTDSLLTKWESYLLK